MKTFLLILSAFLLAARPALAIDPGMAKGTLQVGSTTVELTHAYALLHNPKELRVLLADREALQSVIADSGHLPAVMARKGQLRGLLIQLDPNDTGYAVVTHLQPVVTSGGGAGVVRRLSIANNRVLGEIDSGASDASRPAYRATFSAPLFTNLNPGSTNPIQSPRIAPNPLNRP